jgi:CHAD domain-containing protein
MKRPTALLFSLDRTWSDFSNAWKKARSKSSEKSVHDLRVSTRRLIAILELANALSNRKEIPKLQKRLKKILKSMGPLRDVQVQLETVSHVGNGDLIADFKRTLKRREKREINRIPLELKRGRKDRLEGKLKRARSEFSRLNGTRNNERIHRTIERILGLRRNEFLKAERRFQKFQQRDGEALHEMRIALKKLRYVVEAAEPVLGPSAKEQSRGMRTFQQLMGDSRDLEMLRAELEKWARKKGKQLAAVPALERLQEKREGLVKKIVVSSNDFGKLLQRSTPKPVSEKTHAVISPVETPAPVLTEE